MTLKQVLTMMLLRGVYLGLGGLGGVLATNPKIGMWGALISVVAVGMASELKPFLDRKLRPQNERITDEVKTVGEIPPAA